MTYDSTADTLAHIRRVQQLLGEFAMDMIHRGIYHDVSKLGAVEKPIFDEWTPKLKGLTFGSPEYQAALDAIKPATQHHNLINSHHPEHHAQGVASMGLADFVEMLFDWKASSERHADGSILRSVKVCTDRFNIDPALGRLMLNTARERGWITAEVHECAVADLLAMNGARAAQAAEAICDYADMNLVKYEAVGDGDSQKAVDLYNTAKRLRDLLNPEGKP